MKQFTQSKFKGLEVERQCHLILALIYKIEKLWEQEDQKNKLLNQLKSYFEWADFYNTKSPFLNKMSHLEFNISESMTLRQLLDVAVPLERFLNQSIKDEHIFKVTSLDQKDAKRETYPLVLVLDHLRSAFNVGSIFRTAECLGVHHVYLVGYTPTPDEAGVQKTAMGTTSQVSWSQHHQITGVLEELKRQGYSLIALETAEKAKSLIEFEAPAKLALIVGNERFGLSESLLAQLDTCLEIPMLGTKNSLNVANSVGIAIFEMVRQWKK